MSNEEAAVERPFSFRRDVGYGAHVQDVHLSIGGEGVRSFSNMLYMNLAIFALVALICAWAAFQAEWASKQAALDVWVIVNLEGVMAQHGVEVPPCLRMNGLGELPKKEKCK